MPSAAACPGRWSLTTVEFSLRSLLRKTRRIGFSYSDPCRWTLVGERWLCLGHCRFAWCPHRRGPPRRERGVTRRRFLSRSTPPVVHFDCMYRGITAISSRESKILAGNRIIAQPYEFKVGAPPGKEHKCDFVDNPNGLFSAQVAPKPPAAMYSITEGMKVCDKRTVIVPPEAGYGKMGMNE